MLLSDCPIDQNCEIVSINLSDDEVIRLCELGLREGSKLKICQHCPFGSLLISKGTERIGISPHIAKSLEVKYV
ncbi:MAG: ferrous iron transport protein A [Bifidobacteriaceae bacterium]|jgi:ferrous iron transport protein A|nr:ferrous iron transport protein A [Bifidobacteriaceae bacterium]